MTTLHGLKFERVDKRGKAGFPEDDRGFLYIHKSTREHELKEFGGETLRETFILINRAAGVTSEGKAGWYVDKHAGFGILEVGAPGVFDSVKGAAAALKAKLKEG